ncbi:MAG: hypothetical protein KA792_11110 [Bacteroidales bacterium]|nr:hypothetical protein [Bacteroidales bacterium]
MPDNNINFFDIADKLNKIKLLALKKWLTVTIIILFFSGLGVIISILYKPVYTAKASFIIEETDTQGSLGALSGLASQFGFGNFSGNSTFTIENLIELIRSKHIVKKALFTQININNKTQLLINYFIDCNKYREEWDEYYNLKNLIFKETDYNITNKTKDSLVNIFYKNIYTDILTVEKLNTQTNIVLITTKHNDELFAKFLAESLINCISGFYIQTKTQRARETFEFLQKRADSTKNALDIAELELAKWQDSRFQIIKYQGQTDKSKLIRNVEILQIVYAEILKNLEISKMNLLNITPLMKSVDNPIIPLDVFFIPLSYSIIGGTAIGFFIAFFYLYILILAEPYRKKIT